MLAWQLQIQNVRYVAHHDEYCQVFSLLQAGAGQIENTGDFGFEVDLPYRDLSLMALRDMIDSEYLLLSQAHYERYIAVPDLFTGLDE